MSFYSFLTVSCAMAGPGIVANLANGAAAAEEGITIEPVGDKNVMQIGADGRGQHSLVADNSVKVTIRLLKTSPQNAILMAAYNAQSALQQAWGQNTFTITDTASGDFTVIEKAAFSKRPTITYAKEAGMNEWTFDAISGTSILGLNNL